MALEDNKDLAQILNSFLVKNRKIVLGILAIVLLTVVGIVGWFIVDENSKKNSIISVEKLIYELEELKSSENAKNSTSEESNTEKKTSEEVKEAEDKAIEELKLLGNKYSSLYAGFRANTAIAEIYFQRKNYEEAIKFYELAAEAVKKSYTEGIACFNAAACADELGDNEKALAYYSRAAKVENFPLVPRAMFNIGRLYEVLTKKDDAVSIYNKILEKYPQNEWALLAKSRIIVIMGNDTK